MTAMTNFLGLSSMYPLRGTFDADGKSLYRSIRGLIAGRQVEEKLGRVVAKDIVDAITHSQRVQPGGLAGHSDRIRAAVEAARGSRPESKGMSLKLILLKLRRATASLEFENDPDTAEWLPGLLQQTREMLSLSSDWSHYGSAPPTVGAIARTVDALRLFASAGLRPNSVSPTVEEGVCVSFIEAGRHADFEFYNSGETLAVVSDGSNPKVLDVSTLGIHESVKFISSFLRG